MSVIDETLAAKGYTLDRRLFGRIWALTRIFWIRPGALPSWIALTVLLIMAPGISVLQTYSTFVAKDMTNAIVGRHAGDFQANLWLYLGVAVLIRFVYMAMSYLDIHLNLSWRRWLTTHLVDKYLSRRTYYDIAIGGHLDNPDQRIQESVAPFTQVISTLPRQLLGQLTSMALGAAALASVNIVLLEVVLAFALVQSLATYYWYIPTVRQNFQVTVAEADLRYGILHVRDNAETVALYQGEASEREQIMARFVKALRANRILMMYETKVSLLTGGFQVAWEALPYLVLVPLFFSGKIDYGGIAQATFAASQLLEALGVVTNFLPSLSAAAPHAVRLAEIIERCDELERRRDDSSVERLELSHGREIRLDAVSLQTPGGEQALVRNLSVRLGAKDSLIIVGRTGVGKSSVLRAMAGLWTRGSGKMEMPDPRICLFLPQKPYMVLGDLRTQLLYPHGAAVEDDLLLEYLHKVNMSTVLEKHGGLDARCDWGRVLSLGEQQRISFARILVSRPDYVFLDEATSAVDEATEAHLYEVLAASGAAYISVGHRVTIHKYHNLVLRLLPEGAWTLDPVAARQA